MKVIDQIEIKIINLQHRPDRRQESRIEFDKININAEPLFHEGKYIKEHGAAGCAFSHSKVIFDFSCFMLITFRIILCLGFGLTIRYLKLLYH